jgi:hypothetical protein
LGLFPGVMLYVVCPLCGLSTSTAPLESCARALSRVKGRADPQVGSSGALQALAAAFCGPTLTCRRCRHCLLMYSCVSMRVTLDTPSMKRRVPTAVGKKRGCGIWGFECAMTRARTVAGRFRGPEKLVFPCFSSSARSSLSLSFTLHEHDFEALSR